MSKITELSDGVKYWIDEIINSIESEKFLINNNDVYNNGTYSYIIDNDIISTLKTVCNDNIFLIYSFLIASMKINLSKHKYGKSITIGIPYYNPNDSKINIYSKLMPLVSDINYDGTFKEYLIEIKNKMTMHYKNQDALTKNVFLKSEVCKDVMELASISIGMKNLHSDKYISYIINSNKNEISFLFELMDDASLKLDIEYNMDKISKISIDNLCRTFMKILQDGLRDSNKKIKEISILDIDEKNKILYEFNDTKLEFSREMTVHEQFEKQVEKTPDNIAVVCGDKKITYRELNEKSNQLARYLRAKCVKSDSIVAIMLNRSIEVIICMMGILKAGGAYLPIDPNLPKERKEYLISDSKGEVLLSEKKYFDEMEVKCHIIDIYTENLFSGDKSNLLNVNDSNNLAYLIYTSGTTGKPKGVMIEHRNLNNLILGLQKSIYYKYEDYLNVCLVAPFYFDPSVQQIFVTILNGHSLYIVDDETRRDGKELIEYYIENQIEISDGTPMHIKMMSASAHLLNQLKLKELLIGGEKLNLIDVTEFYCKFKNTDKPYINNLYGPTECSVDSSIFVIEPEIVNMMEMIPIGKPMVNYRIYILDKYNELLPIGVIGELCIAGEGVARGYLNNKELTTEKFVDNPYKPGTKMYKTGDLARWLPDGNLEYLGRIDNQAKIRGFRIELGEIESIILQYESIKEATVVVLDENDGDKYLCAYILGNREVNKSELRDYLKECLPDYMIPSYFMQLDKMPITPNGKLDKKSLPKPILEVEFTEYEAPRNELEKTLAEIWSDVLGVDKVGINNSFFELGGYSLKAMTLISRIHKEINREVPLKELFKSPTIKGISQYIESAEESIYSKIEKIEEKEFYEASSAQKRMYIVQKFDEESTSYNMLQIYELHGEMDKNKIEDIFRKLVERHEALRTYFEVIEDEIVQKIDKNYRFELEEEISYQPIEVIINDFARAFQLGRAPLFRCKIIKNKDKAYLFIDKHHIISDGVSMGILMHEFAILYNGGSLEPLKLQYKDFAVWQNNFLRLEQMKKQEEYWLKVFEDEIPVLNMPIDYDRPTVQSFVGDSVSFEVDKNIVIQLKELTRRTETTMHMVLLSAFTILLSKYSGQEDMVIGTPIAGRSHADIQNIMGIFVNTLALRNKPVGSKTYVEFLNEVKENSLKAYENQSYQLETLIEKLNIVREMGRSPLFDVMFNMIDTVLNLDVKLNDMTLIPFENENNLAKFDLTLNAMEQDDEIIINIEYCSKLFSKSSIERLGKHYLVILEQIVEDNVVKIGEIELLSDEEKNEVLYEFNDTKSTYPTDKTIKELFEEQVEKTPGNIAVEFEGKKLTYKELNEKTNSLAATLRIKGITTETIISIMVDRSIDMIVGILAILKAGGAYLPIDPNQPKDRTRYILEECEVKLLLTQTNFIRDIDYDIEIIDLQNESIYINEKENLRNIGDSNNLAYIIYTSGSTGLPKGVMIEHKAVVRLVKDTNYIDILSDDVILQLSNYAFDGSVFDIFGALLNGAKLVLISKEELSQINRLGKVILDKGISIFFVTTALFNTIVDNNIDCLKNIRKILFGGERISVKHAKKTLRYLGPNHIVHVYGPTEGAVFTTYHFINTIETNAKNIPIGKSISNSTAYVLGKSDELLPIGVPGELCIGGNGIARGYIKKPELTGEKFIPNTYKSGEIIYKTGDLVRCLSDGSIEFLGRIDNQVKIRGFRIELGEIENSLLKHKDVSEAVVTIEEDREKEKYICAYVVGKNEVCEVNLREYLKEFLPEYMIPTFIIQVERLTLTANGKLDKRALPKPKLGIHITNYEAPRNDVEEILVRIWSEVLGVYKVGINDSFFELGGHSLKAMTFISKLHKEINREVPLKELFKSPTVKGISEYIKNTGESMYSKIETIEEKEYYEASSAQKRMYIVQGFDKESTAYNMPQIFELHGPVDKTKIENIFRKLVERHEALRTYFEIIEEEIVQKIDNNYEFKLEEETSNLSIETISSEFFKAFKLETAPLFRCKIIRSNEHTYLLIDMHHIISDGVSMGILLDEFVTLYSGGSLEPLRLQYKDFTAWQNNFLQSEKMKKQEEYWTRVFEDEIPVLNMPTDYDRPAVKSFEGDSVSFEVDKNITVQLIELIQKTETTIHMALLSAFMILLSKYSGQEDIVVGTPIAGRPHADLQNIMGMFVNTLPIRNKPESHKKYLEFLSEVKENSLKAYENQSYQLEILIDKLNIVRNTSRNPLFDVMFNMIDMVSDFDIKATNDSPLIPYNSENNIAKFDLTLSAILVNGKLSFTIQYYSKLFNKETIGRLARHYKKILEIIVDNNENEIELGSIELLLEEERLQILDNFNNTMIDCVDNRTIYELFQIQAKETPDNIAVVFEDKMLTYKDLNEKSNSLAKILRDKGIKPNSIVAIMVEGSIEMAVGILGILKSGAAYLPIDPTYPKQRIEYILEDSKSELLLCKKELADNLRFNKEIVDLSKEDIYINDSENVENLNSPRDLAYVIYTSGTTGQPKGVLICHQSLTETLLWRKREYQLSESHVILPVFNYIFDGFVINFFAPIISGCKVILVHNYDMVDPYKLVSYIRALGVTHYISVPSIYLAILSIANKSDLDTLKVVTLAGEKMPQKAVEYTKMLKDNIEIVNEYGPTENTVITTIMRNIQSDKKISIGKPISNTKVYILNSSYKMQPIGVPGEIFIGGSRLAKGYLNRPELDAERFIESFYNKDEKLYRTGDYARWLPDGSIDFINRIDNQVKIRGFRIELGEIESVLAQHKEVLEAVVLVKTNFNKEKYICAYVVGRKQIDTLDLKKYLKERLPAYMVPSYCKQLEKMPVTPNGKINRKVLSKLDLEQLITNYEAPKNQIDNTLVEIWKDILSLKQVSINDNFFEIGGHSFNAINLVSRLNKEFNVEISFRDVLCYQTIKELSDFISGSEKNNKNMNNDNVILLMDSNKEYDDEENLFIIHDGSGDIGSYLELSSNLKGNIKCWAIKFNEEDIYKNNNFTIEELARKYINILKKIQPTGSYNLAGWSLGGVIAFEIVRQLEYNAETIKNLFLIDSNIYPKSIIGKKIMKEDVSLDSEKEKIISYISNSNLRQSISKEASINKKWNVVRKYLSQQELAEIKKKLPEEYRNIIPNIQELNLDELVKIINIIRRLINAVDVYKPKSKVKKCSILYKATEDAFLNVHRLSKCFADDIIVNEIPGNHYTMMKRGNVECIAESINQTL